MLRESDISKKWLIITKLKEEENQFLENKSEIPNLTELLNHIENVYIYNILIFLILIDGW